MAAMDVAAHVLYQAAIHRFIVTAAAAVGLAVGLPIVLALRVSGRVKVTLGCILGAFYLFTIVYFIAGPSIATSLVYHLGEKGAATITGSYPTGDIYNNQRVYGYDVLIHTAAGGIVQTRFEEDDFNVYPSSNDIDYPDVSDLFNVRYLPGYPSDFVIVTNDDSPWALSLQKAQRCDDMKTTLLAARAKYAFDRGNAAYRTSYISDIRSFIAQKCYTGGDDLQAYYIDIQNVEHGLAPLPYTNEESEP